MMEVYSVLLYPFTGLTLSGRLLHGLYTGFDQRPTPCFRLYNTVLYFVFWQTQVQPALQIPWRSDAWGVLMESRKRAAKGG